MSCAFNEVFDSLLWYLCSLTCGGIWAGEVEKIADGKFPGPLGSKVDNANSSWYPSDIDAGLSNHRMVLVGGDLKMSPGSMSLLTAWIECALRMLQIVPGQVS